MHLPLLVTSPLRKTACIKHDINFPLKQEVLLASEFNGWLSNPCIWLQTDDDTRLSERGPVEEKNYTPPRADFAPYYELCNVVPLFM